MRVYHERLRVPVSWWVLGMISVFMLGAGFLAGFDWEPALAVYGILTLGLAAILVGWGWLSTEVADGELRVGRDRLPLAQAGEVTAMDDELTSALEAQVVRELLAAFRQLNETRFRGALSTPTLELVGSRTMLWRWVPATRTLEISRPLVV